MSAIDKINTVAEKAGDVRKATSTAVSSAHKASVGDYAGAAWRALGENRLEKSVETITKSGTAAALASGAVSAGISAAQGKPNEAIATGSATVIGIAANVSICAGVGVVTQWGATAIIAATPLAPAAPAIGAAAGGLARWGCSASIYQHAKDDIQAGLGPDAKAQALAAAAPAKAAMSASAQPPAHAASQADVRRLDVAQAENGHKTPTASPRTAATTTHTASRGA
jgi:hypothetical protein